MTQGTDGTEEVQANKTPAFEASVDAAVLQDALAPVLTLVDECKIHLDDEGVQIRAVDPANVGMIDLTVAADTFGHWATSGQLLGINLSQFDDVLAMADSDDTVALSLDLETRKLEIAVGGLEYTMALIDPDSIRREPDIPDLDLPCMAVLEGRDLSRAVTAADMVSDHIELSSDGDALRVVAEGDTDDVELTLTPEDLMTPAAQLAAAESLFSLDYLSDMVSAIGADDEVRVDIGGEMPVTMEFEPADGVDCEFMLAPRIQS